MTEANAKAEIPSPPAAPARPAPARVRPRARPYLRLLWLIPSLAVFAIGLYAYRNVEPGGTVESIKLTTKPGPVGQASEALRLVTGTYDLYLKIKPANQPSVRTSTYEDMAIGNGLVWPLPRQFKLQELNSVDVWDEHTFRSDKNLDHINTDGNWSAEGQMFHIELIGKQNEAPKWALPTLAVGGTLSILVLLRFIWDQVV